MTRECEGLVIFSGWVKLSASPACSSYLRGILDMTPNRTRWDRGYPILSFVSIFSLVALTSLGCSQGEKPSSNAAGGKAQAQEWKVTGDPAQGRQVAMNYCKMCHKVEGQTMLGNAPDMDKKYVTMLLDDMKNYEQRASKWQEQSPKDYEIRKKAFDEILAIQNPKHRLERWLATFLRYPGFDRNSKMVNPVVLKQDQLEDLLAYLLSLE